MPKIRFLAVACCVFLCACDGQPETRSGADATMALKRAVTLSPDEITRLGISTTTARPRAYIPNVHGYGVVIELSKPAELDADVLTAAAAAKQSEANLRRARALYGDGRSPHAISLEGLEAIERQAEADQIQLLLAQRREITVFGQDAPWRSASHDKEILARLTSGKTVLVEATFPLGVTFSSAPKTLTIARLNTESDQAGFSAATVWDAPADPTIPGRSFFGLVDGSDLAEGERVLVFAPTGPALNGVEIPSEAILLSDNSAWCYVLRKSGEFIRIPIELHAPVSGGYFISRGIGSGEAVVIKGTGLLLAREMGTAAAQE